MKKNIAKLIIVILIATLTPLALKEGNALWYNANWPYRVKITSDSSNIAATETDMPLYVDLSLMPTEFFNHVKTDGSDIIVTAADEVTVLNHELVEIDTIAKTGELHFKAPNLSHSSDTDFYIYYGNAAATDSSSTNTWSEYEAVWHLNEPKVATSNLRMGVATQAAMDGGDGSWAVLHGSNPISTVLNLSVDEDQLSDTERAHTTEQVGYWVFDSNTGFDIRNSVGTVIGEVGKISNLGTTPTTQNLNNSYTSPVVITTPNLISASDRPAVVRISGTTTTSFTAYMQNPGDIHTPSNTDVYYLVMEEGSHTLPGGFLMEAGVQNITGVNEDGNWGNAQMQLISTLNTYTKPVVLGQVMTNNDANWQVFWTSNGTQTGPPTNGSIYVGRHVGADPNTTRAAEDVGYVIVEESTGITNSVPWVADLGADTIEGSDEAAAPYSYSIFGSATGNPATDSTLNSFDAFFHDGVSSEQTGQLGKAIGLDGGSEGYMHISGLNYTQSENLDELTASLWLKTNDTNRSGILDFDRSEHWEIGLNFHNAGGQNGRVSFDTAATTGGIQDLNSSSIVNDNNWHHVVVVFDKNDATDKKIYIDGILSSSADQHSTGLGRNTTRYGFMGDGSEASTVDGSRNNIPYEGLLDEVRIKHSATTPERILTTYNNEANNAAFWTMGAEEILNNAPTAPTDLYVDHTSAQAGQTNPSDLTVGGVDSRVLFFSAIYNEDDTTDTANEARIQVSTDPTFAAITHWDSGFASIANVTKGNRSADIEYDNFGNAATLPLAMNDGAVTYYWRIAFKDDGGLEGAFSAVNTFTLMDTPATPTGLSAMKIDGSPDVFNLEWVDNSLNEEEFEVEVKRNTGSGFGSFGGLTGSPTTANTNTLGDTDTADNEAYQYRVRACNYAGCSTYDEDPNIYYTDPEAPDGVYGKYVSDNEFTLNYIDRSVLNHVDIERCAGFSDCGALNYTEIEDDLASTKDTLATYDDNGAGITSNQAFRWRVRGTDTGSTTTSEFTLSPYEYTSPADPSHVEVVYLTDNLIQVDWTDNSDYEDGFRIWVSENGGAFSEITAGTNTVAANTTNYIFNTASANKTYAFRVVAHVPATSNNLELFSGDVDSATVKTSPALATGVSVTYINDGDLQVDWTDNAFAEDGYRIYVSEDGTPETLATTLAANSTSYHFNGGGGDHSYRFSVEAFTNANAPLNPTELSKKTALSSPAIYTTPNAPNALTANQVFNTSIKWSNTDNSNIEKGFILYEADAATEIFRLENPNLTLFTESGLTPNTAYTRTIGAFQTNPINTDIVSSKPATTTVYTLANPPAAVTSNFNGNNILTLTWDDGGNPPGTEFLAENITAGTNSGWGTNLSWIISPIQCDTNYEFQVSARNGDGVLSGTGIIEILNPCSEESEVNNTSSSGGGGYSQIVLYEQSQKKEEAKNEPEPEQVTTKEGVNLEDASPLCEDPFWDIISHPQEIYIEALYCADIISGRETNYFRPQDGPTRAEFLKMVLGIYGYPETVVMEQKKDMLFEDIKGDEWHAPYLIIGRQEGIVSGYSNGEFRPNQIINQAEALKILMLAADYKILQTTADDPWYIKYLKIAEAEGWLNNFEPGALLTRGEAAEIIYKTLQEGHLQWLN